VPLLLAAVGAVLAVALPLLRELRRRHGIGRVAALLPALLLLKLGGVRGAARAAGGRSLLRLAPVPALLLRPGVPRRGGGIAVRPVAVVVPRAGRGLAVGELAGRAAPPAGELVPPRSVVLFFGAESKAEIFA